MKSRVAPKPKNIKKKDQRQDLYQTKEKIM